MMPTALGSVDAAAAHGFAAAIRDTYRRHGPDWATVAAELITRFDIHVSADQCVEPPAPGSPDWRVPDAHRPGDPSIAILAVGAHLAEGTPAGVPIAGGWPVPSGHVQWKGTDVCLDFHCLCGAYGHVDDYFVYRVECGGCGRRYAVPDTLMLMPLERDPGGDDQLTHSVDVDGVSSVIIDGDAAVQAAIAAAAGS